VTLDKVSRLLCHSSVRMTEEHYAPWVKAREQQLEEEAIKAMRKMGAVVTIQARHFLLPVKKRGRQPLV